MIVSRVTTQHIRKVRFSMHLYVLLILGRYRCVRILVLKRGGGMGEKGPQRPTKSTDARSGMFCLLHEGGGWRKRTKAPKNGHDCSRSGIVVLT